MQLSDFRLTSAMKMVNPSLPNARSVLPPVRQSVSTAALLLGAFNFLDDVSVGLLSGQLLISVSQLQRKWPLQTCLIAAAEKVLSHLLVCYVLLLHP